MKDKQKLQYLERLREINELIYENNDEIIEIEDSRKKRGLRHPRNINVYWYDLKTWRVYEEKNDT